MAIAAGVDVVDVKEPHAGPLGMAPSAEIAKIAAACRNRTPLSVAVGEIRRLQAVEELPRSVWLLKAGPAGCGSADEYFRRCAAILPSTIPHAAVAYADWQSAAAPQPLNIATAAIDRGARWLLLDTFRKDGRSLLDYVDVAFLARLATLLHASSVRLAIAGSLRAGDIRRIASCGADVVAFRSAACQAGRTSTLSTDKLQLLRSLVRRRAAGAGDREGRHPTQQCSVAAEPRGR